ncbi:hypothetical protein LLE49_22980 [Alicyclobacillus tolerans]|uniref:hypothetical protein n=1 Tax=Alicyclobacillus tolerans TaxID=90970 RepID=UPI001F1724C7|nr:hypothetical protein [Alicyclobacillus tolerans]MCF8567589.1 hypothetical protein [Alicyclobacillus tolerans]
MKKALWVIPVFAIGMTIGGLTLPNIFASTRAQASTPIVPPTQAQQYMQQALGTPQGQAMIQACGSFMSQFNSTQK